MKKGLKTVTAILFVLACLISCEDCDPRLYYTITATATTGGTISPSGAVKVRSGADATFLFSPSTGYSIAEVLVDNASVSVVSSYTFESVDNNHSLSVSFAKNTTLEVTPVSLNFEGTKSSDTISISNSGSGTLSWTVEKNAEWLSVFPSSGTNAGAVTVNVDRTGLSPNSYMGTIAVDSNGGGKSIPVTLTVTESTEPVLQVLPTALDFGLSDTAKPIAISNVGEGSLSWTISRDNMPAWLSCSSYSGNGASSVTVQVDRSGLGDGTYPKEIAISSNGGTSKVQVSMRVENPKLNVSTQNLDFGTLASGTKKPFSISNTGGGTLTWTASVPEDMDWLSLSESSGTGDKTINATIDKDSMDAGTYSDSIAITSNGGNATVSVSMVVGPPVPIISPTSFNFDSSGTSDSFKITNRGEGNLTWSATESLSWLSVSPASGKISGGGHKDLTISIDRSSSESGHYSGTIMITTNAGSQPISVQMDVSAPVLAVSPESKIFGTDLTSQTFSITNNGGGILRWNVSDNASWLSITPTSGTNDEKFTATVTRPSSFASDLYTATISVTSNGGAKSIPVSMQIPSPKLAVDQDSFNFGSTGTSRTVKITNTGGGILSWSATPSNSYIAVSPSNGTTKISPDSDTITITINRSGLSSGTYSPYVTISSNGGTKKIQLEFTVWETIFEEDFDGLLIWYNWSIGNNDTAKTSHWGTNKYLSISGDQSMFCSDKGDSYRHTYDHNMSTYMQRKSLNLSNWEDLQLSFCYYLNTTPNDRLEVNIKKDGYWTNVLYDDGKTTSYWSSSSPKKIDLGPGDICNVAGKKDVIISFDFVSNEKDVPSGDAGAWIDNVKLIGLRK